jgi:hypothetical protein
VIAVSDSSPVILLSRVGYLQLLPGLFTEIVLPQAVYQEVMVGRGRPGAAEVSAEPRILVRSVQNADTVRALLRTLNRGEAEAIALAGELLGPVELLIDEAPARREAIARGLKVLGTGGVLARAKERGLLPLVKPVLDQLRTSGMYLSETTYGRILTNAGEARGES